MTDEKKGVTEINSINELDSENFNSANELNELTPEVNSTNKLNELSPEEEKYLYGNCDTWVKEHFSDGLEIVAIMMENHHEEGIVHCYLRNPDDGHCYDVRGEFDTDEDLMEFTEVDIIEDNVDKFIIDRLDDFELFLQWAEFETVKDEFLY